MGFTLIECLLTLFFIAMLATLALTSNTTLLNQHQSNSVVDKLVHDLKFAREQAILRQSIVTICPSLDEQHCSSSEVWALGYLVFIETTGEKLINTSLMGKGMLKNSRDYIQFGADGFARGTNSTFVYSAKEATQKIIINLQGRIRVE